MNIILEAINSCRTLPVIEIDRAENIIPLSDLLVKKGFSVIEITLRSPASIDAIKLLRERHHDITIGAGTVVSCEQAVEATNAGANFLVSPGFDPELVKYVLSKGMYIIPGVNTPSHVQQALSHGIRILKFFPAELSGGADFLKTLGVIYPDALFIPSGGINSKNLQSYLNLSNVLAIAGSWMVDKDLIKENNWERIDTLVGEVINIKR